MARPEPRTNPKTETLSENQQWQNSTDESREADAERIARRAYERYEARGGEHGKDQEDWFAAEEEVRESRVMGSGSRSGAGRARSEER